MPFYNNHRVGLLWIKYTLVDKKVRMAENSINPSFTPAILQIHYNSHKAGTEPMERSPLCGVSLRLSGNFHLTVIKNPHLKCIVAIRNSRTFAKAVEVL